MEDTAAYTQTLIQLYRSVAPVKEGGGVVESVTTFVFPLQDTAASPQHIESDLHASLMAEIHSPRPLRKVRLEDRRGLLVSSFPSPTLRPTLARSSAATSPT